MRPLIAIRPLLLLLLLALYHGCAPTPSAPPPPDALSDATGHPFALPATAPQRLVSLSPATTLLLAELALMPHLVATNPYDDQYLPEFAPLLASLPRMGDMSSVQGEALLALRPDLILLTTTTEKGPLSQMRALGLPVFAIRLQDFDDILQALDTLGQLTHTQTLAQARAQALAQRRERVLEKTQALPAEQRPSALFFYDLDTLSTAGAGTFYQALLHEAGGLNAAASLHTPWPTLTTEWLLRTQPTHLFVNSPHSGPALEEERALLLTRLRADTRWQHLKAIRNGQLHLIGNNALLLPGPRLFDALETTAQILHPELFAPPAEATTSR